MTIIDTYKKVLSREFKKFPRGIWNNITVEETKIVIDYFLNNLLQYSDEDINNKLKFSVFEKYKLCGLMKYFNNSPYELLKLVYPDKNFRKENIKRKGSLRIVHEKFDGGSWLILKKIGKNKFEHIGTYHTRREAYNNKIHFMEVI